MKSSDHPEPSRRGPAASPAGDTPRPSQWLVLGYGNTLRGDDAAGPRTAEAIGSLNLPGVRVEIRHQLTPEIAEMLAATDRVIFIDAAEVADSNQALTDTATLLLLQPAEGRPAHSVFGHHQDPAALLALAERLYGRVPRAWLLHIAAHSFELGAAPTLPCARGISRAIELTRTLCAAQSDDEPASARREIRD